MNDLVKIWEQSRLVEDLPESQKNICINRMEQVKEYVNSFELTTRNLSHLNVNIKTCMYPIVKKLLNKQTDFDAKKSVEDFILFVEENQNSEHYDNSTDKEIELTFNFCDSFKV